MKASAQVYFVTA